METRVDVSLRSLKIRASMRISCIAILAALVASAYSQSVTRPRSVQVNGAPPTSSPTSSPTSPAGQSDYGDGRYRIGPGDVLDIKVFNKPQFSREGVKVDPRGMIRMPLVKQEIKAACRNEDELAAEITTRLKEYVREPEVIIQIKEYLSEPVAVLGAVRSPARFQLQRRVRLLELLTFANGPTDNAGRTIQVVHMGPLSSCGDASKTEGNTLAESEAGQIDYYKLTDTLRGDEKANPYVQPGDVISIQIADQVYVIGNVVRPTSLALTDPMTVSRAIAMAGGPAIDTKKSEIHIVRQTPGSTEKKDIVVNLDAINHHKAEDVVLMANDIVDVPASGFSRRARRWEATANDRS